MMSVAIEREIRPLNCVVRHDPPRPVEAPSPAYCGDCQAQKRAWIERQKAFIARSAK